MRGKLQMIARLQCNEKSLLFAQQAFLFTRFGASLSVVAQAPGKLLQRFDTAGFGAMTPFL